MATGTSDVTVLGAGIVGLCCALAALEEGLSVTLVDADEPGCGASHGNAGVVSPWSVVPQNMPGLWRQLPRWLLDPLGPVRIRRAALPQLATWGPRFLAHTRPRRINAISDAMADLMRDNIPRYRSWLAPTGQEGLLRDSLYVNAFRDPKRPNLDDLAWRLRIERGASVEIVEGEALRAIEPAIAPEYASAVIIWDQARAISPGALCRALADEAARRGALFRRARVRRIESDGNGGLALTTGEGSIPVWRLVLAAGMASAKLLEPLGYRFPLLAERGYHVEFPDPGVTVNHSLMDVAGKVVASTMEDGLRIAGTSEITTPDTPPDPRRAEALIPLARRLLPGLRTDGARTWSGIRPSLPDSLPAIGPLPGLPNLCAAFGHSHYGLGMAPATGRLVADDLVGRARNNEPAMLRPDRFVGARRA